jgi:import inner membrane translocase subunit TIM50
MLPRAAARAVRQRSALPTSQPGLIISSQWRRQYARSERPRAPSKPQPEKPTVRVTEDAAQGPVKNRTWSPNMGINFVAPPPSTTQQQGHVLEDEVIDNAPPFARDPAQDLKSDFMPQSNAPVQQAASTQATGPDVIAHTPSTKPITPSSDAKLRHSSQPAPESTSTQPLPDLRQGLPPSGLFTDKAFESQEPQSTGPLPDLRQGIPSSFGEATSTTGPQNPSLNLTEDPALGGGKRSEGDEKSRAEYVSSIERRRNMLANYMYLAFGTFATIGTFILGRGWDQDEALLHPDAPNGWTPGAVYGRIKERLGGQLGYYTEPAFPKLLPDMDPQMRAPYTLVLSLEDLLVSSKWDRNKGWQVAKRPGVDYFLRYLSQYYELVIFTSVSSVNADMVVRKLDPFRIVSWPLFREATRYKDGQHVKVYCHP